MRYVIKISGEVLYGTDGKKYDRKTLDFLVLQVKSFMKKNHQVALVCGGGNLFRGADFIHELGTERTTADCIGILGTIQNALVLRDFFIKNNIPSISAMTVAVNHLTELYVPSRIIKELEENNVVLFGGGIGIPFFSSDTCAIERALEIKSDYVIITKNNVDGIYDKDPNKEKGAKKYDKITTTEILEKKLAFADHAAISLMRENKLKAKVVSMADLGNSYKDGVGTEIIPD